MKNLIKFSVIFLGFFIIFSPKSIAADSILPLPKPTVDQETKAIIAKKKEIYPQKKPVKKAEKITEVEDEQIIETVKTSEPIYPQKKPIIFKKKIDKAVTKSTILSTNDLKITKAAFDAIKKKKWQTALKLSKKANLLFEDLVEVLWYQYSADLFFSCRRSR